MAGEHVSHRQDKNREREQSADPESPGHVFFFGIRSLPRLNGHRLQRHAALGAVAWTIANDFRVHGAGVERACSGLLRGRLRWCLGLVLVQKLVRVGLELVQATRIAEIKRLPLIIPRRGRSGGFDLHSAHRVDLNLFSGIGRFSGGFSAFVAHGRPQLFLVLHYIIRRVVGRRRMSRTHVLCRGRRCRRIGCARHMHRRMRD